MGQAKSAGGGAAAAASPQAAEVWRMRQDYLHKIGIQKDAKNTAGLPRLLPSLAEDPALGNPKSEAFVNPKREDGMRLSFLRQLSYHGVWVPEARRSPKHQTVVIFDWDDTLLCTSFLQSLQGQTPRPVVERQLRSIEKAAAKLLEQAMQLGRTFIITNAATGWVEYSAAKWVPGLLPILQQVRVISARGNHEAEYPDEVAQWKIQAFLELQRQMDSQPVTNLISVGDSQWEMHATQVMGKEFEQAVIKTIKFKEQPTPEELLKQIELVADKWEKIAQVGKNLEMGLERKRVIATAAVAG